MIQPPALKLGVVISYPKRFISNLSSSLVRGGVSLIAIGESHLEASALVLVDMAPQMEAEGARRIQAFRNQKPEGFDTLQEMADAIANYQPHRLRPRLLDGLAKNVRLGADGKYHWHWDPTRRRARGDQKAYWERLHACANHTYLAVALTVSGSMCV